MSIAEQVDQLIAVTERLGEVVDEENNVLRERRPVDLARWRAEKERLTGAYERQMLAVRREPAALKAAPTERLDALRAVTKRFQDVLEEHRRLVQATKTVTERMLKAIARECGQQRPPVENYNRAGMLRPAFGAKPQPLSLALNQVV